MKKGIATNNILSIFNEAKIQKKTIFINGIFYIGNKNKYPKITISYLKDSSKIKLNIMHLLIYLIKI